MNAIAATLVSRLMAAAVCIGLIAGCATTTSAQGVVPRYGPEALDAMLAPIALYPDPLLSQVLMAATYPREVEEAARWSRARPGLSGDAAVRIAEDEDWDPSVRSLLAFPLVLDTMALHIGWTEDLGAAFLAQPQDVMDSVQHLRRRAYANGSLRSNDHIRVFDTGREIVIEPASAQIAHVPHYDSRVVYGAWWWPTRPPVVWARWPGYAEPPGYVHLVHWGPGIRISAGFFFGGIVWPRREVHVVNVHSYYYAPRRVVVERRVDVRRVERPLREPAPGAWRHDPSRRRGGDARAPEHRLAPEGGPRAPQPRPRAVPVQSAEPAAAPAVAPRPRRDERDPGTNPPRRVEREDGERRQVERAPTPQRVPPAQPDRRAERRGDPPRGEAPTQERRAPDAGARESRRAERAFDRDEPRAGANRQREADTERPRSRPDAARAAERGEPAGRPAPRGRDNADERPGRAPQRGAERAG